MTLDQQIKSDLKNWTSITRKYIKPNTQKATIQVLNTYIPFIGIWILMYYSFFISYWITLPLAILNGLLLVRIFVIQHDCGHQSFLKSTKANNIIGVISSIFTSIPFQYWAKVHGYHHLHSGELETRDIGDIDFLTVDEFNKLSQNRQFGYRIFRTPIIMFLIIPVIYLLYSNRFPLRYKEDKAIFRWQLLNNFFILGVYIGVAMLIGWKVFIAIQVPTLVVFICVAYWFFYVQHQHEFAYKQWESNWNYLLSAIRGSTYYKLPKVLQWFSANIGFHHIHHLNCGIPNYNLEQCARENPILQKYVTTVSFKESISYAHNKLWCENTERMITFSEYTKN